MPLRKCNIVSRIWNNNSVTADMQNYRPDNKDGCDCHNPGPKGERTSRRIADSDRRNRFRGNWMESLQIGFELLIIGRLHRDSPWPASSRAAWLAHTGTLTPLCSS